MGRAPKFESSCDRCGKPVAPSENGEMIKYKYHLSAINELHEFYRNLIKNIKEQHENKTNNDRQ